MSNKTDWEKEQEKNVAKNSAKISQAVQSGEMTPRQVFFGEGKDVEFQRAKCPGCESLTFGFDYHSLHYCCRNINCTYYDDKSVPPTEIRRLEKIANDFQKITGQEIPREGLIQIDTYNILGLRK